MKPLLLVLAVVVTSALYVFFAWPLMVRDFKAVRNYWYPAPAVAVENPCDDWVAFEHWNWQLADMDHMASAQDHRYFKFGLSQLSDEVRRKADEYLKEVEAEVIERTTFDVDAFTRNLESDLERSRAEFEKLHAEEINRLTEPMKGRE